jgi:hypothetical protein
MVRQQLGLYAILNSTACSREQARLEYGGSFQREGHAMQQWEYMLNDMFTGARDVDERHLNSLGEEGWELVNIVFNTSGEITLAIMKRPKVG